jgi:hypothetical protein
MVNFKCLSRLLWGRSLPRIDKSLVTQSASSQYGAHRARLYQNVCSNGSLLLSGLFRDIHSTSVDQRKEIICISCLESVVIGRHVERHEEDV